jgi:hypothetical protein
MGETDDTMTTPPSRGPARRLAREAVDPPTRATLREARLGQALKANMARRKSQSKARGAVAAAEQEKGE